MTYLGPQQAGQVFQPQFIVTANGAALPAPVSASVSMYNNYRAGAFSVLVALQDGDAMDLNWFASQTSIEIEIYVYFGDASPEQPLIVGMIDDIDFDLADLTVMLTGRDLSAKLIDTKTADLYSNQTSSEVITTLAQSAGLTPMVTVTTTLVGQYYAYDHVRMALGGFSKPITQWDLATYLADNEGFDLFVEGSALYFQPKALPSAQPYLINYQRSGGQPYADVISIKPSRSLTIAKGTQVTVKSWSSKKRAPTIATAGNAGANGQTYVIYQPNLTPEQATLLAQQRLAQITKFEKKISIEMPGDIVLTPRMLVQLAGSNTAFDQLYWPDEIVRSISVEEGFTQSATLLNHPPVNQPNSLSTTGDVPPSAIAGT